MEFKLHNQMFDTPKEQTKCSTRTFGGSMKMIGFQVLKGMRKQSFETSTILDSVAWHTCTELISWIPKAPFDQLNIWTTYVTEITLQS